MRNRMIEVAQFQASFYKKDAIFKHLDDSYPYIYLLNKNRECYISKYSNIFNEYFELIEENSFDADDPRNNPKDDVDYYLVKEDCFMLEFISPIGACNKTDDENLIQMAMVESGIDSFLSSKMRLIYEDIQPYIKKYQKEGEGEAKFKFQIPLMFTFHHSVSYEGEHDCWEYYHGVFDVDSIMKEKEKEIEERQQKEWEKQYGEL